MLFIILILSVIVIGFCLTEGNSRKSFLGILAALIYFPLGVIFALTKKYK